MYTWVLMHEWGSEDNSEEDVLSFRVGQRTCATKGLYHLTNSYDPWVSAPLNAEELFHRLPVRPLENADVYMTIHNSSNTTRMK